MRSTREPGTPAHIVLAVSMLVGGYFVAFDAGEYLSNVTAEVYGRFWPARTVLFVHIATGSLALVAGAVQFGLAYLRRTSNVHRLVGRVYVSSVLAACVASLVVIRNGSVIGPVWTGLLVILAVYAALFTTLGWIAARKRQWQNHAAWMLRSYMAMMVFAWFRLAWELPVLEAMAPPTRAATILGLAMAVSLAATELILAARVRRRLHAAAMD